MSNSLLDCYFPRRLKPGLLRQFSDILTTHGVPQNVYLLGIVNQAGDEIAFNFYERPLAKRKEQYAR